MFTTSSFRSIENKHAYRGKDCIKKFCEFLRDHAMKIINFKKTKIKYCECFLEYKLFYCCQKMLILKYMDHWEKFNKTSLLEKEDFCSHLNIKDITDADYAHAKRVCKDFEIKKLGEYHDLYVRSDILLLADVFENFGNMCLKIYELDPAKFPSAPGLAWQAALKKD